MPTKFPISLFERTVNLCLKVVGASIVGLWIGLWFMPGLLAMFIFAQFMSGEAAASFGALVWTAWVIYWSQAGKLPQVRVIGTKIDVAAKLCFRANDPRYFEEEEKAPK